MVSVDLLSEFAVVVFILSSGPGLPIGLRLHDPKQKWQKGRQNAIDMASKGIKYSNINKLQRQASTTMVASIPAYAIIAIIPLQNSLLQQL